ncbi:MAG: hypothetical protein ACI4VG_05085, partial [Lachnospiraceae bacterium]
MLTKDKKHREKQKILHFRFTQKGFMLDNQDGEYVEDIIPWKERFEFDKWEAVYAIGFEKRPKWLDAAGSFLYQVADGFQQMLTRQPDLEVAREHIEVSLDENVMERLLNSVPFTLGAEYVNSHWLKEAFGQLQAVYAKEIASYEGTVALYLADKSQNLKVPERIF